MKRIVAILLCMVLMATCFTACGEKEAGVVNLLTYEGYIPEEVVNGFKEKTGITISLTAVSSNEEMYEKLKASPELYDLTITSDYMLDTMIKEEMLLKLDTSKIPNFKNIDPEYQSKYYDSANEYTVPYAPGRPLIVYDSLKITVPITSYADLWKPELANSLAMFDDPRVVTGITLLALGKDFNSANKADLDAALEKLKALKPNIKLLNSNFTHENIISGDASIGLLFTSAAAMLSAEDEKYKIVYPSEGLGFGIDCLAVSSKAPNADNTYKLLDYLLDAEIGAQISESILYLCANKASEEFLSEGYKNNPALFISEDFKDAGFIMPLDDATNQIYSDNWTAFKNSGSNATVEGVDDLEGDN